MPVGPLLGLQAVEGAEATETENHPLGGWTTKRFYMKKHLFDVDGSLYNSVLSKRCFFRYNRFVVHPPSGCFSVSVASAPSTA